MYCIHGTVGGDFKFCEHFENLQINLMLLCGFPVVYRHNANLACC